MQVITESAFNERIRDMLLGIDDGIATAWLSVGSVTGPGRSGAVAAVYASHILRVPFIPYGSKAPTHLGRLMIIDTAMESGATIRKAVRRYKDANPVSLVCYHEPPRVMFWYESGKPQRYRHENDNADSQANAA
ncbi:hypothetical protein EET67_04875 [Pseudaminobacter arsenicus]|uniref:Uncharacterized protein n=1 Tax=Borborobacter arsenicus TaxID=1851146 RepID=A0A432V9X6_9HYPH|nr:hypothetical protein [Pseudaminobacter arsenicus]RUM98977.1 hypothetical protein EET67_04875 [Pseudaminobacter arsenicus]